MLQWVTDGYKLYLENIGVKKNGKLKIPRTP